MKIANIINASIDAAIEESLEINREKFNDILKISLKSKLKTNDKYIKELSKISYIYIQVLQLDNNSTLNEISKKINKFRISLNKMNKFWYQY